MQIAVVKTKEPKVRNITNSHIRIRQECSTDILATEFLDDHRALEPPDPIPNSVVKRCIADGSVGFPHVRVGHRQDSFRKTPICARR